MLKGEVGYGCEAIRHRNGSRRHHRIRHGFFALRLGALSDFYVYAMNSGSATGVVRESPLVWAVVLGALSYGALVTLAIGSRTAPPSVAGGIRTGAIVGFLLWFTADFMLFGISNVGSLASTMLDPLLELVPGALAGGLVAGVLGKARVVGASEVTRESHV